MIPEKAVMLIAIFRKSGTLQDVASWKFLTLVTFCSGVCSVKSKEALSLLVA